MSILQDEREEVLITAVEFLAPCTRSDAQAIVEAMTEAKRELILGKIKEVSRLFPLGEMVDRKPPNSMNAYEAKQEAKRERLRKRATKKRDQSQALLNTAHRELGEIPFGQPILVGHHSQRPMERMYERNHNRLRKGFNGLDEADKMESRADAIGTAGISSDDPEAIQKLKKKIENIRRLQKRIETLENEQECEPRPDLDFGWYCVHENKEERRIQFLFLAKPSERLKYELKRHGFRYSPLAENCKTGSKGAWQTTLSPRGRYNAERLVQKMNEDVLI